MAKKLKMAGVDAMAVKDGYIAKQISYEELCPCLADKMTKMGSYDMEEMDEPAGPEEED